METKGNVFRPTTAKCWRSPSSRLTTSKCSERESQDLFQELCISALLKSWIIASPACDSNESVGTRISSGKRSLIGQDDEQEKKNVLLSPERCKSILVGAAVVSVGASALPHFIISSFKIYGHCFTARYGLSTHDIALPRVMLSHTHFQVEGATLASWISQLRQCWWVVGSFWSSFSLLRFILIKIVGRPVEYWKFFSACSAML